MPLSRRHEQTCFQSIAMHDQKMSAPLHFVLIHIGDTMPSYINTCIHQIRLFNPPDSSAIWVLANEAGLTAIADCGNLRKIPLESLSPSPAHCSFRERYTNEGLQHFWKYTIERFFYLEEMMNTHNLQNVFHLENDTMLYRDVTRLLPVFLENYKGMGVTLDCDYRCIPGLVFVRDLHSLGLFNQYAAATAGPNKNDMQLLADFVSVIQDDEVIQTLPVLLPEYDRPLRNLVGFTSLRRTLYTNHFDKFHGIFDAAALGQYLGGISPRNTRQPHTTVGFINETCIFQSNFLEFTWETNENSLRAPFARYEDAESRHPVFTLHIHSKNLAQFLSDQRTPGFEKNR
jgi:hypothetical protein